MRFHSKFFSVAFRAAINWTGHVQFTDMMLHISVLKSAEVTRCYHLGTQMHENISKWLLV